MVALIRPNNFSHTDSKPSRERLRLVVSNEQPAPLGQGWDRSDRSSEYVRSGPSQPVSGSRVRAQHLPVGAELNEFAVFAVALAVLVFGFMVGIRLIQGSPDSSVVITQSEQGPTRPAGYSAPQTVVAQAGDSMWSIAASLQPGDNQQPAVEMLIEANGGPSVVAGQEIIVPKQLVG